MPSGVATPMSFKSVLRNHAMVRQMSSSGVNVSQSCLQIGSLRFFREGHLIQFCTRFPPRRIVLGKQRNQTLAVSWLDQVE